MSDQQAKKVYFASDFHLGVPTYEKSLEREKKIVAWLNHIEPTALEIFLVGDIFDFWFEYKHLTSAPSTTACFPVLCTKTTPRPCQWDW